MPQLEARRAAADRPAHWQAAGWSFEHRPFEDSTVLQLRSESGLEVPYSTFAGVPGICLRRARRQPLGLEVRVLAATNFKAQTRP